jgi:hypothetical protein
MKLGRRKVTAVGTNATVHFICATLLFPVSSFTGIACLLRNSPKNLGINIRLVLGSRTQPPALIDRPGGSVEAWQSAKTLLLCIPSSVGVENDSYPTA